MRSCWTILCMLAAATLTGGLSHAQPAVPPATAEAPEGQLSAADKLFNRGRERMDAGQYREACLDFEQSDRLDHKLATRLWLANCYERIGRIASAWEKFTQVEDEAKQKNKSEPEQLAHEGAAKLRSRLPWLTIVVADSVASLDGVVIKRDNVVVARQLWDKPVAIDSGEHTIVATAPGKHDWTKSFTIKEAQSMQVQIDQLDSLPMSRGRIAGLAVGGIGVAGVIAGSILGISAIVIAKNEVDACPPGKVCTKDKPTALKLADGSTATFIVGGAALGAAAVLYFTAPVSDETKPRTSWQLAPLVTHSGAGVLVGRTF